MSLPLTGDGRITQSGCPGVHPSVLCVSVRLYVHLYFCWTNGDTFMKLITIYY